jgi:hypothetical protein
VSLCRFFRPFGASLFLRWRPTACAVGCILSPLRGCIRASHYWLRFKLTAALRTASETATPTRWSDGAPTSQGVYLSYRRNSGVAAPSISTSVKERGGWCALRGKFEMKQVSKFQRFKVAWIDASGIDTESVSDGCPISRALFVREVGIFLRRSQFRMLSYCSCL